MESLSGIAVPVSTDVGPLSVGFMESLFSP